MQRWSSAPQLNIYLESEMMETSIFHVSVLKALSCPKQPIQIGWLCLDTQI